MSLTIAAANTLFTWGNAPRTRRFFSALRRPALAQRRILEGYLNRNAYTQFGERYGFATLRHAAEFQQRVPISTYDDYESFVEQIAAGRPNVLTRDRVRYFALSSGSTRAEKWIPYTRPLLGEFRNAIAPWIATLYRAFPRARTGPAYWSITPVGSAHVQRNPSKVPVGFDEDSAYLGGVFKHLVDATFAVPGEVRHVEDIDTFRYVTLLSLLRTRNLALISVWHPSFLSLLLATAAMHWEGLLRDIRDGTCSPPGEVAPALGEALRRRGGSSPQRARELERIGASAPGRFWPDLSVISTWTDGHAAAGARELAGLFPGVPVQPKGLLATEGVTSFPLVWRGATHYPLALCSHFFEFLAEDGRVLLAQELDSGCDYTVLLTTGGGLYRYNTGDRVTVTGRLFETPTIRFLGKAGHTTDLRGEKLNALFVAGVFEELRRLFNLAPRFSMLAPDVDDRRIAYTLFIELPPAECVPVELAGTLDTLLSRNPHYAYCRALGQLDLPRVFRIGEDANARFLTACAERGQRLGNIKPTPLHQGTSWAKAFRGAYVSMSATPHPAPAG